MASPRNSLVCKACGYVNESERIYCHNCGTKLNREMLIPQQEVQEEMAQKKQREVKKIMSPGRGNSAKTWRKLWKTAALAAVAGLLIDAVLPPEGVTLPAKDTQALEALPLDTLLESLTAAPTGKRIALREADVNAYLRRERFRKLPSWLTDSIPLRALVHFEPNNATFTLLANVAGHPLCATLSGSLKSDRNAGIVATCTGGSIGRIQIPAQLAGYAGGAIPLLLDSMKRERELLGQLGSIEIGKQQIILGAREPSAPAARVAPSGAAVERPAIR